MYSLSTLLFVCCLLGRVSGQTLPANAEQRARSLRDGVESKDPDVRVQAIVSASMIGRNEAVIHHLETMLQDKDVAVRIAAISALADLKATESKPALEKTLKQDQVPEVGFAAAKALYALQDPAGTEALMSIYDGKINPNSNFSRSRPAAL